MKLGLVLILLAIITRTLAASDYDLPTTRPPTPTKNSKAYCCNKCPPVKVTVKTIVHTHVFKVNIPYPVFKALPTSSIHQCPEHFKRVSENKCVHYVKSNSTCPPGYFRVSDESCLKVVVLPPKHPEFTVKCPKGYTHFQELGCKIGKEHKKKYPELPNIVTPTFPPVKVKFPEPAEKLECPKDYIRKGKYHCVKVVNCPKGYSKNKSGFCVRSKVKCPKGFTRLGRTCVKSLKICPRGYKYNEKDHSCSKHQEKIYKNKCEAIKCANPNCKDGYKLEQKPGACCPECKKCKCPSGFNPVCGTDGITYKNVCTAKCLGATVAVLGACPNKCQNAKNRCPYYYRPVCGEDNVTYSNRCAADQAKVKVKKVGVCPKVCRK